MLGRSLRGEVYLAKFGSSAACIPWVAPLGVSGAGGRSRLSRANQKLVLVRTNRTRLGFLSRRSLGCEVCSRTRSS
jgi:hypothetical protein